MSGCNRGGRALLLFAAVSIGSLPACDDGGGSFGFDVAIVATPERGNAPLAVTFAADENGPVGAEFTYAWDFGDGETADEAEPTHVFTSPGTYEIAVRLKAGGDEGSATRTVEVLPSADLLVDQVRFEPQRAAPGAEIVVSWGLRNAGAEVVGQWALVVYLSQDGVFGPQAIELERLTRADDPPSTDLDGLDVTVQVPEDLPSGEWIIGVFADPEARIGDADRDNNRAVAPVPLRISGTVDNGPDLIMCGVRIPAFEAVEAGQTPIAQLGDQLPVRVCFGNIGNRPVAQAGYTVYLSRDDRLSGDDVVVGQRGGLALGQDDRGEWDELVDLPLDLPPGRWRLLVAADPDNEVIEQREDNNEKAWPNEFELVSPDEQVPGVDLVAATIDFPVEGDRVFWGQTLAGTLRLLNRGDTAVERAFPIRIVAEPTAGGAPVQIGSVTRTGGIAAGADEQVELTARIGRTVQPGEYRLSVVVDPTNSANDVNPGNNRRILQRVLRLGGEPDLDAVVSDVSLDVQRVDAGGTVQVSATVANPGGDATGVVQGVVVLSADAAYDRNDVVVDSFQIPNLAARSEQPLGRSVVIPVELDQQVGAWHVAVVLDPDNRLTGERSEDNNVAFAPAPLQVDGATGGCAEDTENEDNDAPGQATPLAPGSYPGLGACDAADWFAVEVPANHVLDVTLTWAPAAGSATLRLADDGGEPLRDGEGPAGRLALFEGPAEAARTLLVQVTGGGARLQYDLTVAVTAAPAGPNLRVRAVQPAPAVAEAGALLDVGFELVNVGRGAAGAAVAGIYVSADDRLDANDRRLGEIATPALAAGGEGEIHGPAQLPADLANGRYRLLVRADDAEVVAEANEDDNVGGADLRVDADQACRADAFEPNGSPYEANGQVQRAAALPPGVHEGLFACLGDDDWYAVRLAAGERLEVTINFTARDGDLDLALYAPDGVTQIAASAGLQDVERVTLARAAMAGDYLVRVNLRGRDAAVNTYRMTVTVQSADACEDDAFEPNGGPMNAGLLPDGRHDLALCPGDEDWFRVPIVAGNTVAIDLLGGAAGVTIALFDPQGQLIDEDNRRVVHMAAVNGTYTLRARAAGVDMRVVYALDVRGVSGVDLQINSLRLSGDTVTPAGDLRADAMVGNLRGDAVQNVVTRFYLSADQTAGAGDAVIGEARANVPGAGEVRVSQRLAIPRDAAPGAWYVVAVADPDRRTPDLRPANNTTAVPVQVVPACVDDDPRTNESRFSATPLDPADGGYEGVICAHTEDWFSLAAGAGRVQIRLAFTHADGDLDLVVLDADGNELGASRGTEDVELVAFDLAAPATIYIGVDGFVDAQNDYALTWTLP